MTPTRNRQNEEQKAHQEQPRYILMPDLISEQGRSAAVLALHRRCSRCWATLYQEENGLEAHSFADHRERIRECCSMQRDYTTAEMPILEVVFRLMLAAEEDGLRLDELHNEVTNRRLTYGIPWSLPTQSLRQMIVNEHYYGIRELSPQIEKEHSATTSEQA